MSQDILSAAVVVGALRFNKFSATTARMLDSNYHIT